MTKGRHQLIAILTAAELVAIGVLAPLLLFPTPARLVAAAIVPLIWVARRLLGGEMLPATPLNRPLLLLLVMVGVSVGATFDVQFSLGKVAGVLLGAFLFWALVGWITSPARLWIAAGAFQLAGAGLAVVALLGTNWSTKFSALDQVISRLPPAIRGLPGAEEGFQPNGVAGLLILFVPLQLALLGQHGRSERRHIMAIQVLLFAVTAATLLLTQSRGAWVGLGLAAVAVLLWYNRTTRIIATVAACMAGVTAWVVGPTSLLNLVVSRSGTGIADSAAGRLELWSRALAGIQDFPITGMGMNAFRRVMPVMYPTVLTSPDVDVAHAHNQLLQTALDLGIPGLIAYVWICALLGKLLIDVYRHTDEPAFRVMAGGLGAGLIAHFCFGLTDAIALGAKAGILFWFTVAMVVALHQVGIVSRRPTA